MFPSKAEDGKWDFSNHPTRPGSKKHAFPEGAECSKGCFLTATPEERSKQTVWSEAQSQMLQAAAFVLRDNPRVSCLIACMINKYCYEIEAELHRTRVLDQSYHYHEDSPVEPNGVTKPSGKRKRHATKDYPPDCYKTGTANERNYFKPCMHTGPCNATCHCVKNKVTCEKSCFCDPDCIRRWRGCNCAASGKACTSKSANCLCVKWNRECDPDLCKKCGAADTLSPTHRYDEELAKACCQNVALQRGVPRRMLLGVSGVSGMGMFAGENIKKDVFLGEYKGQIITNEEAERRGKLYDKRGVSFLFNLNKAQVIDAARAGNKFRFVNHSKKPNAYAKVLFVNSVHRIGMFAKRNLVAGEELYFDYGYNGKILEFVAQEPEFVFQPPAEKSEKPRQRKRQINRKGNLDTGMTARTSGKRGQDPNGPNGSVSKPGEAGGSRAKGRARSRDNQQAEGSVDEAGIDLDHPMADLTIQGTDDEGSDEDEPIQTRRRLAVRTRQKSGETDGEDDENEEEDDDGSGSDDNEEEDGSYGGADSSEDEDDDDDSPDVDKIMDDDEDEPDEESERPRRRTRARRQRAQNNVPAKKRRLH